ncbi:MAG: FAD-dependent oxidoreductase [Candidatus Eremiobacteraeota bacterium]|nr:FAD-dependent oxidoreductase [Candidatus Eremiobacteraeota bacterium]
MVHEVIIIGAGAAGLAAARRLVRRSGEILVLEARERVGGRVWSHNAAADTPGELGAEFIHGRAALTYALLREAGLSWNEVQGERWHRSADGMLEREDDSFASDAALFDRLDALHRDVSVRDYLADVARDPAQRPRAEAALAFIEGFDAADPELASARAIAAEWRSGVDATAARPLPAYGPLFEFLREGCVSAGVVFHFATAVERIAWSVDGVTVVARNRGGTRDTFHARCCIVTLPAGVLRYTGDRAVIFDPPLPSDKERALGAIETGHVVKVVLWFRTRFWERFDGGCYRDAAFLHADNDLFATYWTSFPRPTGLVAAWVGGPKSAALGGRDERALVDGALRGFGSLFGEERAARDALVAGAAHDWRTDPYARGAYSYLRVDGGDARATLAAPLAGALFFAGEATALDGQSGTVNGALETGERAAAQAAAVLRNGEVAD